MRQATKQSEHALEVRLESLLTRRLDRVAAAVTFILPASVYAFTACPTVYWGDTGEFLVAAIKLGIPHSPGTPLYPMLGRLLSLLGRGAAPLAVNLMSGLFAAISSLLVYLCVRAALRGRMGSAGIGAGVIASLTWAFTNSLWSYSTVAEVYTLQMAMVSGLMLIGLTLEGESRPKYGLTLIFFYLCGLGLSSNVTVLLLIPGFVFLMWRPIIRSTASERLLAAAVFLLGITPYLYLPLRSAHDPVLDWGNPETVSQLLWVVTAREFARNMLGFKYAIAGGLPAGVHAYYRILLSDLTLAGMALCLIGAVFCFSTLKRLFFPLAVIYLTTLAYSFAFGADLELEAYLLPSLLVLVVLLGLGTARIMGLARGKAAPLLFAVLLALPAYTFVNNVGERNQRRNSYARRVGEALLSSVEGEKFFFTDNTVDLFAAMYVQAVEKQSPGVTLVYLPYADYAWYRNQLEETAGVLLPEGRSGLLEFMLKNRSCYTPLAKAVIPAHLLLPRGMAFEVSSDSLVDRVITGSDSLFASARIGPGIRDYDTRRHFAIVHSYMAEYFYARGRLDLAIREYGRASSMMPENCEIRLNLARALESSGLLDSASAEYSLSLSTCRERLASLKGLSRVAMKKGDFPLSREYLLQALALDMEDPAIYYNLGLANLGEGRIESAAEANAKALKLKPDFVEAITNLGVCYLRMGRGSEAAALFRRAISLDPSYVQAYLNLAEYCIREDSIPAAQEVLREGLSRVSQDADIQIFRAKLLGLGKVGK